MILLLSKKVWRFVMRSKIVLFVLISLVVISIGNSVIAQEKPIKLGLRGGLNLARTNDRKEAFGAPEDENIEIDVMSDIKNRTCLDAGCFIEYALNKTFAIQVNALYNQKGEKSDNDFTATIGDPSNGPTIDVTGNTELTVYLDYISFPVLGKVYFGKPGKIRPYIMAGPEISILTSAKTSEMEGEGELSDPGGTTVIIIEGDESDINDEIESIEYGLNLGCGFTFPLGQITGFVDFRYGMGLNKINKAGNEDVKSTVISVNIGYIF
jgi:hypothetical protein